MKNPFEEILENKELLARIDVLLMKIENQYFGMKDNSPISISKNEVEIHKEIIEIRKAVSEKLEKA